jgi:hypothetical protein
LAEIIAPGLIGHLVNGRVIKGGGEIGVMPFFIGQFDNPQQAVAQPAVFLLHQVGQGLQVAPPPNPSPSPDRADRRGRRQAAEAQRQPQPLRRIPKPVRDKQRQKGRHQCAGRAAQGDRRFDAPEAAFDLGELKAESLRQRHGQFVIIFGHALMRLSYVASTGASRPKKKRQISGRAGPL